MKKKTTAALNKNKMYKFKGNYTHTHKAEIKGLFQFDIEKKCLLLFMTQ